MQDKDGIIIPHHLHTHEVRGGLLSSVMMHGGEAIKNDVYYAYFVARHDRDGNLAGYQAWYRKRGELFLPSEAGAGCVTASLEALHMLGDERDWRRRANALTDVSPPGMWVGSVAYLDRR